MIEVPFFLEGILVVEKPPEREEGMGWLFVENGIESEAVGRSRDIAPAVVTSWGKRAERVVKA